MNKKKTKLRLDQYLVEKEIALNIDHARRLIMAGKIMTKDGNILDKPGITINPNEIEIHYKTDEKWVSKGGNKLEHAIVKFSLEVKELKCLDIGASTGGFTDVLIGYGAKSVTAIDVGYGIIHTKLRNNPKVKILERTNFRTMSEDLLDKDYDLITIDVSFISLKLIIPKAAKFLKPNGKILSLIKPQFEAPYDKVEKGGKVFNPNTHLSVILNLVETFSEQGIFIQNITFAPIIYKNKNIEYLTLWQKKQPFQFFDLQQIYHKIEKEVMLAFENIEITKP